MGENENIEEQPPESQQGLGTFAARALRGQQGAWERNQAQLLIEGNLSTNPAKKIGKICDAAIGFEGIKAIEGLDTSLMKRIAQTNRDLSNPCRRKIDRAEVMVLVGWSFKHTKENYDDYIASWYQHMDCYSRCIEKHRKKAFKLSHKGRLFSDCGHVFGVYSEETLEQAMAELKNTDCPSCGDTLTGIKSEFAIEETTVVSKEPFWSFFFEASECLTEQGYNLLCNAFHAFAVPLVIHASSLMLKNISPSTYEDALKFLSGKEEEDNEGSVD